MWRRIVVLAATATALVAVLTATARAQGPTGPSTAQLAEKEADAAMFEFLDSQIEISDVTMCHPGRAAALAGRMRHECSMALAPSVRVQGQAALPTIAHCMDAIVDHYLRFINMCGTGPDPRTLQLRHADDGSHGAGRAGAGAAAGAGRHSPDEPAAMRVAEAFMGEFTEAAAELAMAVDDLRAGRNPAWSRMVTLCKPEPPSGGVGDGEGAGAGEGDGGQAPAFAGYVPTAEELADTDGFAKPHPIAAVNAWVAGLRARVLGAAGWALGLDVLWGRPPHCVPMDDWM